MAALLAVGLLAGGCSSLPREPTVPEAMIHEAVVPGMGTEIRSWGGMLNPEFKQEMIESVNRERALQAAAGQTGPLPPADFLALSGGGANGAFGAGLLCGWTAAGNRPQFKLVTGVSTGALMAPFVFAGPDYDNVLRILYTQTTTKDIAIKRGLVTAIFSDAMYDNAPLRALVAKYMDAKLLAAIAREYRKGRLLIIATTDLDAGRAVLWNVGAIACYGDEQALNLVRSIMVASAAIPGVFPPVMIEVEAQGQRFQEMHVDGGAMTQVFLYPPSVKVVETAAAAGFHPRVRRAYIIRNSKIAPEWAQVDRSLLPIAGRAVDSLIQTQGVGDLYRTYANTQRDGIDFNLAYIPDSFAAEPAGLFDKAYMKQLFDLGYEMARHGYPWLKLPPYFEVPDTKQ